MALRSSAREVVIVGAGIVGIVLAMFLSRQNHRVTIYEGRHDPRKTPPPPGRSINLTLAARGWTALRELGIDPYIRELSIPLRGRLIHGEGRDDQFQPYAENGEAIYSISRFQFNLALLDLADRSPNIAIRFNHRCVDLDLGRRTLTFER